MDAAIWPAENDGNSLPGSTRCAKQMANGKPMRRLKLERPPKHEALDNGNRDAAPGDRARYQEAAQYEKHGLADTALPQQVRHPCRQVSQQAGDIVTFRLGGHAAHLTNANRWMEICDSVPAANNLNPAAERALHG
jgi:hypothetical protein